MSSTSTSTSTAHRMGSLLLLLTATTLQVSSFSISNNQNANARQTTSQLQVSMNEEADSNSNNGNFPNFHDVPHERRLLEFTHLEPLPPQSELRRQRIKRDDQAKDQFAPFGNELWTLRSEIKTLTNQLVEADELEEDAIRERLHSLEQKDPEFVYKMEMEAYQDASLQELPEQAHDHYDNAMSARSCLPQFNLDGLWVGKYGRHGYELINITYAGDTLMAFKVTGDSNVPRGEISFQADLSPFKPKIVTDGDTLAAPVDDTLPPIQLTDKAAQKWGTTLLPRHKGLGQVAEPGFNNNQWMEGQLISIGKEYFSFAWVPIEQQIFFGRPSPELALKMLREGGTSTVTKKSWDTPPSLDDDVTILKDFVANCLDKTVESVEDELMGDAFSCIWRGAETEEYSAFE